MRKYIYVFVVGMFGALLGGLIAWFIVLDPNALVYTFIDSLPQPFRESVTNLFVFFGLVTSTSFVFHFARIGYMSATRKGNAKLKTERTKESNNKFLNFIYKHSMRFVVGLSTFALFILIYVVTNHLDESASILSTVFVWVICYAVGYAVLRLWGLTWSNKLQAKLDAWEKKDIDDDRKSSLKATRPDPGRLQK